jgi:hypothetical protein
LKHDDCWIALHARFVVDVRALGRTWEHFHYVEARCELNALYQESAEAYVQYPEEMINATPIPHP